MVLLAHLFAALALVVPALAQPADCPAVPVGPPVDLRVFLTPPGRPGMVAGVDLPPTPMFGTRCVATVPPSADVLRGPPAPNGLLQGNGPRDVLHNQATSLVIVGTPALGNNAPN
jgi:hypothetical protein